MWAFIMSSPNTSDSPKQSIDDDKYYFLIPKNAVKQIVTDLFGRPQTATRSFTGEFAISKGNVQDLNDTIYQRIYDQNHGDLIQFTIRVTYNDNSTILFNSIDDFMMSNDVKPVSAVGAILSWSYLIQFHGRGTPEKQDILVSLHTGSRFDPSFLSTRYIVEAAWFGYLSSVQYVIQHTSSTWSADVEALLRDCPPRVSSCVE